MSRPPDFASADAAATGPGGCLATVTSQGEHDFLNGLTRSTRLYRRHRRGGRRGTWRWLGGPEAGKSFFSTTGAPIDIA